jgi:hypothetical protein
MCRSFSDGSRIVCVRSEDASSHREKADEVRLLVQVDRIPRNSLRADAFW